jgi:hypothetical protein
MCRLTRWRCINESNKQDLRVWIEGKVQPASAFFDEYSAAAQAQAQAQAMQQVQHHHQQGGQLVPQQGGQMMMVTLPPRALREDVEAAARYLFFIEKRNALNALLELVQARMGVGLSEVRRLVWFGLDGASLFPLIYSLLFAYTHNKTGQAARRHHRDGRPDRTGAPRRADAAGGVGHEGGQVPRPEPPGGGV